MIDLFKSTYEYQPCGESWCEADDLFWNETFEFPIDIRAPVILESVMSQIDGKN